MYTKQEVYNKTLEYFQGDELATNVWISKYCLKNKEEQYLELTPDDTHHRLAKEFHRIEQKYPNPLSYEEIYRLLTNFRYVIPGGSILYGVGNIYSISSLGNCFVVGNSSDSYGGICQTDQEQAQLMKRRAGVGHDISHLRPKNTSVTNSAGTSTGAVSFMERYSNTTREVAQNGRRGALMLSMDINHPDIEDFVIAKDDLAKITGANISVKITDEFMSAVENNIEYDLHFIPSNFSTLRASSKINIIKVKAKELWNKLIHQAWKTAEPGVLFWDKIKSESIPSCYGKEWKETSTNP
jgi:ribonucleoside-diphosphate reductase alpha chain